MEDSFYILLELLFMDDEENYCTTQIINLLTLATITVAKVPQIHAKIGYYVERTVPQYGPDQFRQNYRLTRDAFDTLVNELTPYLLSDHNGGAEKVEPSKQILLFCWYLANQDSLREIGHLFGLSVSTVHGTIYGILDAIVSHLSHLIPWPNRQKQTEISDSIARRTGIRGMIGFIDGTHIRLCFRPKGDQDYVNRKGYPSLQLQIVADPDMKIIAVNTGWPGCAHDARVLRNSSLYMEAEAHVGQLFCQGNFIVGDSAYPSLRWLVTVFKNNGHLTEEQTRFNVMLSRERQIVERTIGHLKCRFRRLQGIFIFDVAAIAKIIYAACILHNMCVMSGDELADFIQLDEEQHPNNYHNMFGNDPDGIQLRNRLMREMNV